MKAKFRMKRRNTKKLLKANVIFPTIGRCNLQENTSVHQDDHHPAELVEQLLGTIKFTKTITKRTLFVHQENFCSYMLLNLEILEPKFENG